MESNRKPFRGRGHINLNEVLQASGIGTGYGLVITSLVRGRTFDLRYFLGATLLGAAAILSTETQRNRLKGKKHGGAPRSR